MKHLILVSLLSIVILKVNSQLAYIADPFTTLHHSTNENKNNVLNLSAQPDKDSGKMSAAMFKSQEYCRAELKDFPFDIHYSIVSASVYFSGANFRNIEKSSINSSSLKPISNLMARCTAGSIVIFDDVKVVGPDNIVRTIPGMSVILY